MKYLNYRELMTGVVLLLSSATIGFAAQKSEVAVSPQLPTIPELSVNLLMSIPKPTVYVSRFLLATLGIDHIGDLKSVGEVGVGVMVAVVAE